MFILFFFRYGDVVPKHWISRCLTIIISLVGMCLVSLIVGSLSSELTVTVVKADLKNIYGAKVGFLPEVIFYLTLISSANHNLSLTILLQ